MTVRRSALTSLALGLALAGCSDRKEPPPPSQQQIHASDSGVETGQIGRHRYRCDDGNMLFVDFKDDGLHIDLRRAADAPPTTLTAPTQGLQYVGDTMTATFRGVQMVIVENGGGTRTCSPEGKR